jgi:hypothetical protein
MSVLIRDLILAAYRGFTGPVYRMTAATGVALLPARAKPPQILAAEIAAAAAFVLTLVALLTRRALPVGSTPGRFVLVVGVKFCTRCYQRPAHPPVLARRAVLDTTAIEVV